MSEVHHMKTEMPWMQLKVMVNFAIIEIKVKTVGKQRQRLPGLY